ncbi:hypothetical protein BJV82DRAFT_674862 [Fennellomyces sp. T-0311]|nr:hypothetical protein BJV82DRAFT_674862 [Fennellomyces sp. T-0311]
MASPTSIAVKPDPDAAEDQDDLLMSYLNADCLAAPDSLPWTSLDNNPPSPPYSTTSSDNQSQHPHPADEQQLLNAFDTSWLPHPAYLPPPEFFQSFVPPSYLQQPITVDSSARSYSSSSSDSEQPKKKRGRKKRDSQPPAAIAPAPLRPLAARVTVEQPLPPPPPSEPVVSAPAPVVKMEEASPPPASHENPQDAQKAAAIAKRQERLIKNRAAALLSRKRKREHLNALEEEKTALSVENEQLKQKVAALEARVDALEKENNELWRRAGSSPASSGIGINNNKQINNRATGVVFMIILFSFALFSLPARTVDQLTVGGNGGPLSLEGGANVYYNQQTERATLDAAPKEKTTDLVLIDPVQPQTLQTWIKDKLSRTNSDDDMTGLVHWQKAVPAAAPKIYLYSPEFSQVVPTHNDSHHESLHSATNDHHPMLSLISPLEQATLSNDTTKQQYLQIDVQVLGSRVIDGQLISLDQCPFATSLLHNFKDDLLNPVSSTPGNETMPTRPSRAKKDMRRKLVGEKRRISRVAV